MLALEKLLLVTSTVAPAAQPPPPPDLDALPPVNENPRVQPGELARRRAASPARANGPGGHEKPLFAGPAFPLGGSLMAGADTQGPTGVQVILFRASFCIQVFVVTETPRRIQQGYSSCPGPQASAGRCI